MNRLLEMRNMITPTENFFWAVTAYAEQMVLVPDYQALSIVPGTIMNQKSLQNVGYQQHVYVNDLKMKLYAPLR